VTVYY